MKAGCQPHRPARPAKMLEQRLANRIRVAVNDLSNGAQQADVHG
jgi:hypothetical protein